MTRNRTRRFASERGIAFVTTLLLLFLCSSLLAAFLVGVVSDSRLRAVDKWRTQSFYAAHAGLEKLTSDLGNLFSTDFSPSLTDLVELQDEPPSIPNVQFIAQDGLGYSVRPDNDSGQLVTERRTIVSGPFQGFIGLVTPYRLTTTAHTTDGSETRLERLVQTVSIPVFQFGIFSETDLSFFPGPDFNFGGRVHTNGNLFLATGATLTLSDRVTAVGEVVRTNLSNTWLTSNGYQGRVRVATGGNLRDLAANEGSLVGTLGSALNDPKWTNLSLGAYNGYLRNSRTGAKRLDLPLITVGASPIDLIRRPTPGESDLVTKQRLFSQASVRILLSDTSAAINNLPGVSGGATMLGRLAVNAIPGYVSPPAIPLAVSSGVQADGYRSAVNTPLHGGFLKVEYRNAADVWVDVTVEWLNLGFTRRMLDGACNEPSPDAIIRIQRIRQNPVNSAPCGISGAGVPSPSERDYWPLVLYDTREGRSRDTMPLADTTMVLGGVMHYIELDVRNLRRWLLGQIGASGVNAVNENGYLVYFSDRRNNRNGVAETGEYGWEDIVNPGAANAAPNGILDAGEDFNSSGGAPDVYGQLPAVLNPIAPLNAAARPGTVVTKAEARVNRAILFRRALKVVAGGLGNLPNDGLTIAAENPVYVQGNFNANNAGFLEPNAPAAIMADAVTLLSNAWSDTLSFDWPNDPGRRDATTTWYRFGVIAGKGRSFPHIAGNNQDYGTDGGVHNFLRYLENWDQQTINYRGAIASFYYSRQATGLYKCCNNVYDPPTRGYNFDTEFLDPTLLPPKTPMFRDVNATGFVQVTRR